MVHAKREEVTDRDSNIPGSNAYDKDSKRFEVGKGRHDVKAINMKEMEGREKDR